MLADGYHFLPPGRLAAFTVYLRHPCDVPHRQLRCHPDSDWIASRAENIARYRQVFRAVGEDWLWFGG